VLSDQPAAAPAAAPLERDAAYCTAPLALSQLGMGAVPMWEEEELMPPNAPVAGEATLLPAAVAQAATQSPTHAPHPLGLAPLPPIEGTAEPNTKGAVGSMGPNKSSPFKVVLGPLKRASAPNGEGVAYRVVEKGTPRLDESELQIRNELQSMDFFAKIDVFQPRVNRTYLDALAHWHTLLLLLCQPHAKVGTTHAIDLEQHLQCFWTGLLLQLALISVLAAQQGGLDYELSPREVGLDAAVASVVAAILALAGCRVVFIWSGVAGRVQSTGATLHGPFNPLWACELVTGRVFVRSTWSGNKPFLDRVFRSSIGWVVAWSLYGAGAGLAAHLLAGATVRKFVSLMVAWAAAQLTSWLVLEPIGVLLLLLGEPLVRRHAPARRARTSPVTPVKAAKDPQAAPAGRMLVRPPTKGPAVVEPKAKLAIELKDTLGEESKPQKPQGGLFNLKRLPQRKYQVYPTDQ